MLTQLKHQAISQEDKERSSVFTRYALFKSDYSSRFVMVGCSSFDSLTVIFVNLLLNKTLFAVGVGLLLSAATTITVGG